MSHDVAKIAEAISRPRIDPRKFAEIAVVTAVAVDGEGVHVDVTTAEGLPETAALASPYAGPGYGMHFPIDLDEAVILVVPDGVYNAGARVVGRVWDAGDPPPGDVLDNPEDVVLVVKPGQSLRVVMTRGGDAIIEPRDDGAVRLGGGAAPERPVQTTDDGAVLLAALDSAIETLTTALDPSVSALTAFKAALVAAGWPRGATTVTAR